MLPLRLSHRTPIGLAVVLDHWILFGSVFRNCCSFFRCRCFGSCCFGSVSMQVCDSHGLSVKAPMGEGARRRQTFSLHVQRSVQLRCSCVAELQACTHCTWHLAHGNCAWHIAHSIQRMASSAILHTAFCTCLLCSFTYRNKPCVALAAREHSLFLDPSWLGQIAVQCSSLPVVH